MYCVGDASLGGVDVMLAIEESAQTGRPVDVESTAPEVPPLDAEWSSATVALIPARGNL